MFIFLHLTADLSSVGDAVRLSLDCSSGLSPVVSFETVDSFSYNLGSFSVDYICTSESSDAQVRNN